MDLEVSSLGKLLTFPHCLLLSFGGKKPKDQCLRAENFLRRSLSLPNPPREPVTLMKIKGRGKCDFRFYPPRMPSTSVMEP